MPKRIQMHRRKGGWRKDHPDAVIVDRRSKWGNPFEIGKTLCTGRGRDFEQQQIETAEQAVRAFEQMMEIYPRNFPALSEIVGHLRGKDLACWCPLDRPCHADVLLRLANPRTVS